MKRVSRRSFSFRIAFPLLVAILLAAACGDDAEVAATTAPATTAVPTTTAVPATTAASTATPTLTFTGSECVYSGPNTFPSGEIIKFTWGNESSVEMVVVVLELVDTLEDLAATFPATEVYPPAGAAGIPDAVLSIRAVGPDTEVTNNVIFRRAGDFGTMCWPIDGNPAIPGELLTVTLSLEAEQEALEREALAVAEAHLAAFNAGDADAVMGLFTADVSISDNFESGWTVTDWEMALAWDIAQGTILTAADCTVTEAASAGAVTVTCEFGSHNAPAQTIGAPPVPTTLTFLVTPEGISELELFYGVPDFTHIGGPFVRWVRRFHPEDADGVGFGLWDSVEEAEQNGFLFAQYAAEWAAFLDAAGCVYPDICFRILTED